MISPGNYISWTSKPKRIHVLAKASEGWFWIIDVDLKIANPCLESIDVLEAAILDGEATVLDENPFFHILSRKVGAKKYIQSDLVKVWEAFEEARDELDDLYSRLGFRKMVRLLVKKTGFTSVCCRKHYRRLLQLGFYKEALLDRRSIGSGVRGKPRQSRRGIRLGTWRLDDDPYTNKKVGIAITDNDRENFKRSLKLFYKKGVKISYVYQKTLETFYSEDSYLTRDGVEVPTLKDPSKIPSRNQFKHWLKGYLKLSDKLKLAKNIYIFNSRHRPFLGRSQDYFFLASEYAIDSTTLHLYIVNPLNPNELIEAATLIIVFCPADMTIQGFHLTLEGDKYETQIQALAHTFIEKVSFYKKYGVEIDENEFPYHHLCTSLFTDRAPSLMKDQSDKLQQRFAQRHKSGFRITNSNVLGPEKKGALENAHKMLEDRLFSKLPGYQKGRADFGDQNQLPKARLPYEQMVHLICHEVKEYNNTCWLSEFPLTEGMIQDDINPIPAEIRAYLIKNDTGALNELTEDLIQLDLLPTDFATVTQNGIFFRNKKGGKELQYYCVLAEEDEWFIRAGQDGSFKVEVSFHSTWTNRIFIRPNEELGINHFIPCDLVDNAAMAPFAGKTFFEVNSHHNHYKLKERHTEGQRQQSDAERNAYREHTTAEAQAHFEANDDGRGDEARLKDIKQNTEKEIERLSEVNRWGIFKGSIVASEASTPSQSTATDTYVPADDSSSLIEQMLIEKLKNQKK